MSETKEVTTVVKALARLVVLVQSLETNSQYYIHICVCTLCSSSFFPLFWGSKQTSRCSRIVGLNSHETEGDLEDVALRGKVHEAVHDAARLSCAILDEGFFLLCGGVAESRHVERCSYKRVTKQSRKQRC